MKSARAQTDAGRRRPREAGFTLAEVLAALLFMAIVIPVAISGLSTASRAGEVAARRADASLVAQRVLDENIATTNWDKTVQNGVTRIGRREFSWTLKAEPWTADPNQSDMRLLSVDVKFEAQGSPCSVRLSTLVENVSLYATNNQVQ